jgi:hypothetical protein
VSQQSYPVLITGYSKWVVWVQAEDAADARKAVEDAPYEWVDGEQTVDGWVEGGNRPQRDGWLHLGLRQHVHAAA